jgi:cell division protein FtsQ
MTRPWRLVRAGTDAVPASVRRFMARAGRRRRGRAWWAAVATVGAVVATTGWILWGSSALVVREIEVTGTERLTPAQVHEAAAVPGTVPLLRVPTDEVAARVAALPPVRAVQVHRSFPGTLRIEVVERTPVAAVPVDDGFRLVDATGVAFFTVSAPPEDLPELVVADPAPQDLATRAGLTVLAALTPELAAELESVVVAGPAEIRLELRAGRVVRWGDETASEEKARVATVLLDRDAAVIDVSAPEVVVTG